MSRLPPLGKQQLEELRPLFDMVEASMGFLPNSLLIMARKPKLLTAFAALSATAIQEADLPSDLAPLIAFVVSRSSGCQYCQAHTHHQAAKSGISAEKLDAIWDYETSALFDEGERAALRVAQAAGDIPNAVTDEDFEELKAHFSESQIVDIVAIVSVFGFLNRWNDTMATPLEDGPLDHADRHLASQGWTGAKHR